MFGIKVEAGARVPFKFSAAQKKLLLEKVTALDPKCETLLRNTPADEPVRMTLEELDALSRCLAAEADQTDDAKLARRLDRLIDRIFGILDGYGHEPPGPSVISMADHAPGKSGGSEKLLLKLTPLQRAALVDGTRLGAVVKRKLEQAEEGPREIELTRKQLEQIVGAIDAAADDVNSVLWQRLAAVGRKIIKQLEPPAVSARARSNLLYQFKITLCDVQPAVWRRIQVRDATLGDLHNYIQAAMGWWNYHLHHFEIGRLLYGPPAPDGFEDFGPKTHDENAVLISHVVPADGSPLRMWYEYDFGDGWRHEIRFEGNPLMEKKRKYPLCLEGERACPPEDVGGPWGYAHYLEALADPNHEQHEDYMEWRGPCDADAFDAKNATRELRKIK